MEKLELQSVSVSDLIQKAKRCGGGRHLGLFEELPLNSNLLKEISDELRNQKPNIVLALIGRSESTFRPMVVAAGQQVSGVHVGHIAQQIFPLLKGQGGGKESFAQGRVKDLSKLHEACQKFYEVLS